MAMYITKDNFAWFDKTKNEIRKEKREKYGWLTNYL